MNRGVSQRSLAFGGVTLAVALCLPSVALAQDAPATTVEPPTAPPPDAANAEPAPPPAQYPPPPPRAPAGNPAGYPPSPQNGYPPAQQGGYQPGPPANYPPSPQNGYPPANYPPPPPRYQTAPGYGPPPGYYYPPPRVNRYSQYYPQVEGVYRPISFTMGIGPGALIGPDHIHEAALSYNLARLGIGVAPNLQLTIAFEGTGANRVSGLTGEDSWLSQNTWMFGVQYWLLPRVYVRLGAGASTISEHSASLDVYYDGTGIAMGGGIGFEFVQTRHVALALDLNGSFTQYSNDHWGTTGANLAVSFF
jgi:hypothetical protein